MPKALWRGGGSYGNVVSVKIFHIMNIDVPAVLVLLHLRHNYRWLNRIWVSDSIPLDFYNENMSFEVPSHTLCIGSTTVLSLWQSFSMLPRCWHFLTPFHSFSRYVTSDSKYEFICSLGSCGPGITPITIVFSQRYFSRRGSVYGTYRIFYVCMV